MSRLETLLSEALIDAGTRVKPSQDLFERVQAGVAADRNRRHIRRRVAATATAVIAIASTAIVTVVYGQGEPHMDWWILEIIAAVVLGTTAVVLRPFIKRFGRSYAADVFRSNPSTGKSFIVLTDFAYYLIFVAYIAFTTTIDRPDNWAATVGAEQVQHNIIRLGGILLIIGVLHGINLLVLPIIGRLLTLNRRLDQQMRQLGEQDLSDRDLSQPDR